MQRSRASLEPEGFKRKEHEYYRAWHFSHDASKILRRLAHGAPHKGAEGHVGDHERRQAQQQTLASPRTQPETECRKHPHRSGDDYRERYGKSNNSKALTRKWDILTRTLALEARAVLV